MKKYLILSVILLLFISISPAVPAADTRPANWAQPIEMKGVPNLHKVSDVLYRSAQPTAEGMKNLEQLGIKTVINLRAFHSDREIIKDTELGHERIHILTWQLEEDQAARFLKIVTKPERTPVLVHCKHGADRTGTMSAVYRMALQGWTNEEALKEMTEGGFGFHGIWQNLARMINGLDIKSLKEKAGILPAAEKTRKPPDKKATAK